MPSDCEATIHFDANGKPGNKDHTLSGVIKTSLKQVMRFEVHSASGSQSAKPGKGLPPDQLPAEVSPNVRTPPDNSATRPPRSRRLAG